MQDWIVRGMKQGKPTEVVLQANDWAGAVAAGRAEPHGIDVRDVTLVGLPALLMARLRTAHGFTPDRIFPTFASKDFMTAVGWKTAVIRVVVPDNGLNQIWLMGEYQSEGKNALVGCMAIMPQDADEATLNAHIDKFSQDVDKAVAETYAGRLLKAA
jgi:hypothetical protein